LHLPANHPGRFGFAWHAQQGRTSLSGASRCVLKTINLLTILQFNDKEKGERSFIFKLDSGMLVLPVGFGSWMLRSALIPWSSGKKAGWPR